MVASPSGPKAPEWVYYDASCSSCRRAAARLRILDRRGSFRLAPLASPAFEAAIPAAARRDLPDSLLVLRADGRLLSRSAALLHLGRKLGGRWRFLALLAGLCPSSLRDAAYDHVARRRPRSRPDR